MKESVLTAIKDTEKKADQLISAAEQAGETALQKAQRDALDLISTKQDEMDKQRDSRLAAEEKKILVEKKKILVQGEKDVAAVKALAQKHIWRTVSYIMGEFEKYV